MLYFLKKKKKNINTKLSIIDCRLSDLCHDTENTGGFSRYFLPTSMTDWA